MQARNTNDPVDIGRWEPRRMGMRPGDCRGGAVCWVKDPYRALPRQPGTPKCFGCGGLIQPAPPPAKWEIEMYGLIGGKA